LNICYQQMYNTTVKREGGVREHFPSLSIIRIHPGHEGLELNAVSLVGTWSNSLKDTIKENKQRTEKHQENRETNQTNLTTFLNVR
jgi:hypothetical protein